MGPRAGLDGYGRSRPTGIRSPDRPARSEWLYRLSYPGPLSFNAIINVFFTMVAMVHNVPMVSFITMVPKLQIFIGRYDYPGFFLLAKWTWN
jgi:hypothetical protein